MALPIDLETCWQQIPIGKEKAITYEELQVLWEASERNVRKILSELSYYDNGDQFILIRSGRTKGFYRTDDIEEIERYRKECLNKGRSIFAPVRKCNRVLAIDDSQLVMDFGFLYD